MDSKPKTIQEKFFEAYKIVFNTTDSLKVTDAESECCKIHYGEIV